MKGLIQADLKQNPPEKPLKVTQNFEKKKRQNETKTGCLKNGQESQLFFIVA